MERKKFIANTLVAVAGIIILPKIIPDIPSANNSACDKSGFRIVEGLAGKGKFEPFKTVRIGLHYKNLKRDLSGLDGWAMANGLSGPASIEAVSHSHDNSFIAKLNYTNGITLLVGTCYPNRIEYEGKEKWIIPEENLRKGNSSMAGSDKTAHRECSVSVLTCLALKLERKLYWNCENQNFKNDDEANSLLESNYKGIV